MDPDKDFLIEHLAELARKPAEPETRRAVFDPEIPQADLGLLRWRVDRLIAASLIPKPARKFPMAPPWEGSTASWPWDSRLSRLGFSGESPTPSMSSPLET